MVFVTGLIITEGAPAFGLTKTVDVLTQPFDGFVAVKVYVPAPLAVVVNDVVEPEILGPDQLAVALVGVIALPLNVTTDDEPHPNV
jgi:hypothetical protein